MNHHGNSNATGHKEQLFSLCQGWSVSIANKNADDKPYWAFDLTAGSGSNPHFPSSPEVVLRSKARHRHVYLVEKIKRRFQALKTRFPEQQSLFSDSRQTLEIVKDDNRKFVPRIPGIIRLMGDDPRYAHGIVISDPNGAIHPMPELRELMRLCPRLDIILRVGSVHKTQGYAAKHPGWLKERDRKIFKSTDVMGLKRSWLVARLPGGRGGAILFFGTNYPGEVPGKVSLGLHHFRSSEGQKILSWMDKGGTWRA